MPENAMYVVIAIVDQIARHTALAAMSVAGWTVHEAERASDIGAADSVQLLLTDDPALIAYARPAPGFAAVPIVLVSDNEAMAVSCSDDRISPSADRAEWTAFSTRWSPHSLPEATLRMTRTFGSAAITPMLRRLAELMAETLATMDCTAAHQLAGVAGTLGFGEVGALWRDFSEGETVDIAVLRRETRLAIGTIVRGTSVPVQQ